MEVEFFHDTVCSFCFPMSYKLREIAREMPDLKVIHRSFALVWEKADMERMFGSMENARAEILEHWKRANETDPLRRFNPEGMRAARFDFPTSKNPLLAAKAAGILWGEARYWDLFDAMQRAMFVESRNICDLEVIGDAVRGCGMDVSAWKRQFEDPSTLAGVKEDLALVESYGITSVPTLIVDKKRKISGSLPAERVKELLMEYGGAQ